jgi:hypothetical protein
VSQAGGLRAARGKAGKLSSRRRKKGGKKSRDALHFE